MDHSAESSPQRLSALYQYHNAPEVAPAHGLEYDDTVYTASDKYPVVHSQHQYPPQYNVGKLSSRDPNNRPPRIIFGMKVRTFLVVALIFALIIVGAAVGGAVGGKSMREDESGMDMAGSVGTTISSTPTATGAAQTLAASQPTTTSSASASASASAGPSSSASSPAAATPTISPLTDCPDSNNTLYTSTYANGASGTVSASSGLNFTKHCDVSSPVSSSSSGAEYLGEAFVYTFNDCIEVCAGYNFWGKGDNCTFAVYQTSGGRPGNCWVGYETKKTGAAALSTKKGTDVAILAT